MVLEVYLVCHAREGTAVRTAQSVAVGDSSAAAHIPSDQEAWRDSARTKKRHKLQIPLRNFLLLSGHHPKGSMSLEAVLPTGTMCLNIQGHGDIAQQNHNIYYSLFSHILDYAHSKRFVSKFK